VHSHGFCYAVDDDEGAALDGCDEVGDGPGRQGGFWAEVPEVGFDLGGVSAGFE
jgi:hypothetical protein